MRDIQSLSSTESLLELKNLRFALLSSPSLPLASALHDAWSAVGYAWGCIWGSPGPDGRAEVLAVYPGPFAGIDTGTAVRVPSDGVNLTTAPSLVTEPHPLLGLVRSFGLHQAASVPLFDGRDLVGGAFLARSAEFSIEEAFDAERLLRPAGRLVRSSAGADHRVRDLATEQASRARDPGIQPADWRELIARLAHMLNNPLTSILGSSELLEEVDELERQQLLALVRSEARRAGRMLRDALDFCAPPRASMEVVDVGALVREVIRQTQPSLAERGTSVHSALGLPVLAVADPRLFTRALGMLVDHRWGHLGSGEMHPPELSLTLTADPMIVDLTISIAPLALSEGTVKEMWEPVDTSAADRGDLKFELPLARLLLASQAISISSDYQPERERLEIRLSFQRAGQKSLTPTSGLTAHLLIDSSPLRKLVELLLIREGVQVGQDMSGDQRANKAPVDLMVIDESWAERRETARASSPGWDAIRVLVLGNEVPPGLPEGGRIELLEKPFDLDMFRSTLSRLIGEPSGRVPEPG